MPNWAICEYRLVSETSEVNELYERMKRLQEMKEPLKPMDSERLGSVILWKTSGWTLIRCSAEGRGIILT